ncbi:uncharacterized protein LOC110458334 [Mizuhopecten yessoensis]|uniref:uncharacterized protein LOC110458334 n=1 Tax=Mizuhopecten yessoensis TaxID=6573 RepID=UPI000B45B7F5|nr:uncharacterized protein LOC110458334 [Mizuhopecten yessoensis]
MFLIFIPSKYKKKAKSRPRQTQSAAKVKSNFKVKAKGKGKQSAKPSGDSPLNVWEGLGLPQPDLPVGGRLSAFFPQWKEITQDSWALSIVAEGLSIPLLREPPLTAEPIFFPPPVDLEKALAVRREIATLVEKSAVEEVPRHRFSPGFYSRFCLVKKKSGAWCPIIDLRPKKIKIETPRGIITSVREGIWATSIDLKDTYFHIPMRKSDRKYLHFSCEGKIFQFRAMPFGLTTAPMVFTKLLQVVVGFIPSREKTELSPSQDFVFLGYRFNVARGIILPTQEKFIKARSPVLQFIQTSAVQVRWYLSLLGFLNSLADVVALGRLHIRPL